MDQGTPDEHPPTPEPPEIPTLEAPRDGVPEVIDTAAGVLAAAEALAAGTGPVAVDTERASGYRYFPRAYLIQLRREGAGTVLLDPVAVADSLAPVDVGESLAPLADAINPLEWVLHAASSDLPSLHEVGLRPARLFDTELGARLAGFERTSLAVVVERQLGLHLRKGHGADDWSVRPLPAQWLNYAALDVELLVPLADSVREVLREQGKLAWAEEEFEHVRTAPEPAPRAEPWRHLSHITDLKSPRQLAMAREIFGARDELARARDRAPSRVLPDSAIIAAVQADPKSVGELTTLPVFRGPRQRKQAKRWFAALAAARALPDTALPPRTVHDPDAVPAANRWSRLNPIAAARLAAVREALTDISEREQIPVENLATPSLVREVVWRVDPTELDAGALLATVADRLRGGGARSWQVSLVAPVVAEALSTASAPPKLPTSNTGVR